MEAVVVSETSRSESDRLRHEIECLKAVFSTDCSSNQKRYLKLGALIPF